MESRINIKKNRGLTDRQRESLNRLSLLIANLPEDRKRIFESEVLDMEATKQIIFKVPESIQRKFKGIAAFRGKSMTELFIELVNILASGKSEIPTRDFTDDEINEMMNIQAQTEKENPELMEWARKRGKN